jgi:hypothetical protein
MVYRLVRWFNKNACRICSYYCTENNVCQSKKCATYGRNPYVNWFDRHFCKPYKAESGEVRQEKK